MKHYPIQSKGINLLFEINLIGYKNAGESMVLSVKNEYNDILWCGIIDCFKYRQYNKTKLILDEYGYNKDNRKIDFLCISHPDIDHIKSISRIMNDYTDDNTMLLMPNFNDSRITQTKEIIAIKEELKNRFNKKYRRGQVPDNIFFNRQLSLNNLKWEFLVGTKKFNMQIEALTPTDSIMLNSVNMNYQQFKNDFSICLKITFNNNSFLFMGDCSDNVLIRLDEEYIPNNISYLKMPHHGCKNETIINYFDNDVIEAVNVSGCAYRKKTTLEETLDFYSQVSNLVSVTADINLKNNHYQYGLLKHTFDIQTGELIQEKTKSFGNAILNYNHSRI